MTGILNAMCKEDSNENSNTTDFLSNIAKLLTVIINIIASSNNDNDQCNWIKAAGRIKTPQTKEDFEGPEGNKGPALITPSRKSALEIDKNWQTPPLSNKYGFVNKLKNPGIIQTVKLPLGTGGEINMELPAKITNMEVVDEAVQPYIEVDSEIKVQGNHGTIATDYNQTGRNLTAPLVSENKK